MIVPCARSDASDIHYHKESRDVLLLQQLVLAASAHATIVRPVNVQ